MRPSSKPSAPHSPCGCPNSPSPLTPDFRARRALSRKLRSTIDAVAAEVTSEFLARHPDWIDRYGDRARIRGIEDARFHIEFLIGALLAGEADSFARYALWADGVLRARGITSDFLIENLEQVREHAARHVDADGRVQIARLIDAGIRALRDPQARVDDPPGEAVRGERAIYLQAVLAGDRQAALTIAREALRAGASVIDVFEDMIRPAQQEIGRLWEGTTISVGHEHAATAITNYVIGRLHEHFPRAETTRGNAVVSGVENELHQLGARMIADVLESDGWIVRFLGSHLPHRDIVAAAAEHDARVVCISAATLPQLEAVASLIENLRTRFGDRVAVVVGGSAFAHAPDSWRDLGADGFASDLRTACEVVRSLTRES